MAKKNHANSAKPKPMILLLNRKAIKNAINEKIIVKAKPIEIRMKNELVVSGVRIPEIAKGAAIPTIRLKQRDEHRPK